MTKRIMEAIQKANGWLKENHIGSVIMQLLVLYFLICLYMDNVCWKIEYTYEHEAIIVLVVTWLAAANEARRLIMKPLRAIKRALSKFW